MLGLFFEGEFNKTLWKKILFSPNQSFKFGGTAIAPYPESMPFLVEMCFADHANETKMLQ